MKKITLITISFLLIITSLITLSSCSLGGNPSTKYEKVKYAFDGVEKSFKKASKTNKKVLGKENILLDGEDEPIVISPNNNRDDEILNTIFMYYTSDDIRGTSLEGLSYDEPPMIQFQYLKKVLEKIGKNYSFGTKYYYDIKGTMYMDISSGLEKEESANYKYDYLFNFAIYIDIDDNDLITAYVTFDVTLTKDNERYNTKWYVAFSLDYDMNSSSPTYTLTEFNQNKEGELPFRKTGNVYEYDYVEVKSNEIKEWRKFCYSANTELIKDENHQSFDQYKDSEGFEYKVDYLPWFKDGQLYKHTKMSGSKKSSLASALYSFGLNSTDINGDEFFKKEGTQSETIITIYNDVCKILGKDVIYDIICRDEDSIEDDNNNQGGEEDNTPTHIISMSHDGKNPMDGMSVSPDLKISDLFSNLFDGEGNNVSLRLFYATDSGKPLNEITDYSSLMFVFSVQNTTNGEYDIDSLFVTADTTFKEAYESFVSKHKNDVDKMGSKIGLAVMDEKFMAGALYLHYNGEIPTVKEESEFPQELVNFGVPKYETSNGHFDYSNENGSKILKITNSNEQESVNYLKKLDQSGFTINNDATSEFSVYEYYKENGELVIVVRFVYDKEGFILEAFETDRKSYLNIHEEIPNTEENGDNKEDEPTTTTTTEETNEITLSVIDKSTGWNTDKAKSFDSDNGVFNIGYMFNQGVPFVFIINNSLENTIGFSALESYLADAFEASGDKYDSIVPARSGMLMMQISITPDYEIVVINALVL